MPVLPILIDAATLRARLGEPGLLPVDVRPAAEWRRRTVPGAVQLDVYDYFIPHSTEAGIAGMAASAQAAFHAAGIDRTVTPVFFEAETGMISPRALWFHEFAGFTGGLVLDGGLAAWDAAGGAMAPGKGAAHAVQPEPPPGPPAAFRRTLAATTDDVLHRDRAATDLLDVRRRTEFEGSFAHPCCARAGRIPGAAFLFYEDLLHAGRYRTSADIAARAAAAGLSPAREVIVYCHRGARAATALYALRLAGFRRVRVYVGSWHEWAADPGLPLRSGPDVLETA